MLDQLNRNMHGTVLLRSSIQRSPVISIAKEGTAVYLAQQLARGCLIRVEACLQSWAIPDLASLLWLTPII